MKLAILFWFYKEVDICENRLKLLKQNNPDLKIYGLYGGDLDKVSIYKDRLKNYLDDFYIFSANTNNNWKWMNGDLMILNWYEKRGINLDWDSVIVVQWDMLVFDSLLNQFSGIKKDQIFISGTRQIDSELENKWDWIKTKSEDRVNYISFIEYIRKMYNYTDTPTASLFILQVFPRIFFDKYLSVGNRNIGMLEYKIPTYAKIFNIPFYEKDVGVNWFSNETRPLNAIPEEIQESYINEQLNKKDGWRIFHPYYKIWPN